MIWDSICWGSPVIGSGLVVHTLPDQQHVASLATGTHLGTSKVRARCIATTEDAYLLEQATSSRDATWLWMERTGALRWAKKWAMAADLARLAPRETPTHLGAFVMASREHGRTLTHIDPKNGSTTMLIPIGDVFSLLRIGDETLGLDTRRRSRPPELWKWNGHTERRLPLDKRYTGLLTDGHRLMAWRIREGWSELSVEDGTVIHAYQGSSDGRVGFAPDRLLIPFGNEVVAFNAAHQEVWRHPLDTPAEDGVTIDCVHNRAAVRSFLDSKVLHPADGSTLWRYEHKIDGQIRDEAVTRDAVIWTTDEEMIRVV